MTFCKMEMMQMSSENGGLHQFFEEVDTIHQEIDQIKNLFGKLRGENERSKSLTKTAELKSLREEIDKDMSKVLEVARSAKSKIEALEKANISNRRLLGCAEGSSIDRTRTSLTDNLRRKLKQTMSEFQTLRETISKEHRDTVRRRLYIVAGEHADEETVEKIISTGQSETLLTKALEEQGNGAILDAIQEIQERHGVIMEIEKGLQEMHQIFLDMAALVDVQGDQLDNIEHNLKNASEYAENGTTALAQAKRHQRSKRKWTCISIILFLLVIFLILVPAITSFRKS